MRENRHRNIEHISSMRSRLGGIEWAMVGKEGYISRDRDEDDEVNKYLCTTTFALCARHRRPSHLGCPPHENPKSLQQELLVLSWALSGGEVWTTLGVP